SREIGITAEQGVLGFFTRNWLSENDVRAYLPGDNSGSGIIDHSHCYCVAARLQFSRGLQQKAGFNAIVPIAGDHAKAVARNLLDCGEDFRAMQDVEFKLG